MEEYAYERRGLFDGLRVPTDPNALLLGVGFVASANFVSWLIPRLTGDRIGTGDNAPYRDVLDGLAQWALSLGSRDPGFHTWTWILAGVALLGLWAFFSAAINRIAAMQIAREESVALKDACRFAVRKFLSVAFSLGFVAIVFGGFYCIANPVIGLIGRVPVLDILVVGLFFPLVILFTFLVVFSVYVGVFGFNLASSAIATESSDAWDGITRAWNYVLERPWVTILVLSLAGAVLWLILMFGATLQRWSVDSLSHGAWGMGDGPTLVHRKARDIEDEELKKAALGSAYRTKEQVAKFSEQQAKAYNEALDAEYTFVLPGKARFVAGYVSGLYDWDTVRYVPDKDAREALKDEKNVVLAPNVASLIPFYWKVTAWLVWLWYTIVGYFVAGFAVQYFFGANTVLYFLLRKEVEGEDYTEIVVDEDEFEDEAAWQPEEPATPAAAAGESAGSETTGAAPASAEAAAEPSAEAGAKAAATTAAEAEGSEGGDAEKPADAGGESSGDGAEQG